MICVSLKNVCKLDKELHKFAQFNFRNITAVLVEHLSFKKFKKNHSVFSKVRNKLMQWKHPAKIYRELCLEIFTFCNKRVSKVCFFKC